MSTARDPASVPPDTVIADTRRWLERAVIGLNLCPFAKAPHAKGQIHYAVCDSDDAADWLAQLRTELQALAALDATERETTLLMAPRLFADFLDFNDFLGEADAVLAASVFHFGTFSIRQVKEYMASQGIPVRLDF